MMKKIASILVLSLSFAKQSGTIYIKNKTDCTVSLQINVPEFYHTLRKNSPEEYVLEYEKPSDIPIPYWLLSIPTIIDCGKEGYFKESILLAPDQNEEGLRFSIQLNTIPTPYTFKIDGGNLLNAEHPEVNFIIKPALQ